MISTLRRWLAIFAAAAAVPAAATTATTDYTDLWFLPAESGWGVNVVQQYNIIFATLFVYGADGTPRWYVAPSTGATASPAGENLFNGPLYSTLGTYFGAPWGGSPTVAQVGTVSFDFISPVNGTVTYTVNGVAVTKSIVRQTWANNVLTGNYYGGLTANGTSCHNGVSNGAILIQGELTIGHSNIMSPTFRIAFVAGNGATVTCTFNGTYTQEGKVGRVNSGTWACSGVPNAGTFTLTQIEANTNGITSRFVGADQFCNYDGYFGGTKDVL